jgi:catechol 2,3-dioxygenase
MYYEQVLGLHTFTHTAEIATLGSRRDDQPLVRLQTSDRVKPARRGAFGLYHFAILLPERAALARFAAHLSALGISLAMADHLVSEALYLWDPDGLGIEVYADRPRNQWRRNDRELVMTTDPLDIKDLIAAGGGHPWDGIPLGTTIGHMHLHVGSLNTAEAFYHRALGFDKTVWSFPGALFLSAGGYHHHLATNTWSPGPSSSADEARLLEWELVVPVGDDVAAVAHNLKAAGFTVEETVVGVTAADPWGITVRIRAEEN